MIYHEIRDSLGVVISSNIEKFDDEHVFVGKENENIQTAQKVKNFFRSYKNCSVRLVTTSDENFTTRIASRTADAFAGMVTSLEKIKEDKNLAFLILSHNLITSHGKIQGEIESVVLEPLTKYKTHLEQKDKIKQLILSDIENAAESMLQISKRVIDMQAQIQGFRMLSEAIKLDQGQHNIKRLLLNILYPFYQDFDEAYVNIHVNIDDEIAENNSIVLDYKIFNVVLHHFLNNAVKYTKPHSKILIYYLPEERGIVFSMDSVKIEKDELKTIFNLGVSGKHAGNLAGDGVGMYMIKKGLTIMGGKIEIEPDYRNHSNVDGIEYVRNVFKIFLSNSRNNY
jgi:signal transduction histidine kinase